MSGLLSPVLDSKVPKPVVVRQVEGNEDEVVRPGYGGDLPVRERWSPPGQSQARAFGSVPPSSMSVVRQDFDGGDDDSLEILLDRRSPLGFGKPVAAEQQLVPDYGSSGHLVIVLLQAFENSTVGLRQQRFG